ncbi:uncharacterized protein LOC107043756 [Diachasma alloeum]|uniref:uncharacterized protein LOC107043756 n=1 Tax=Diachasma alloeum TaxID=454923 RepID=UPI0010FB0CDA|nr:uncharacterized protein LOC107043756 [Diachasma alloeum]
MKRYSILIALGVVLMTSYLPNALSVAVDGKDAALRAVSTSLNEFAVKFYKAISEEKKSENLISSPVSVSMVLSMAAFGAGGETAKEMRSGLHLPADDAVTKSGFESLINTLNNVKKVKLQVANKIFTASGFEVKPAFKEVTTNSFKSAVESLNFGDAEAASATINAWSSAQTNGLIKDVIKPDDLAQAAMVLVNAVYFKGQWKKKFNESLTKPKPFYINEKTTQDVPMMTTRHSYNYGTLPDLDAQFVELPYEHEDEKDAISMFIILPNSVEGLRKAESNFHHVNFQELHNRGRTTDMYLYLPKFKTQSSLNLEQPLKKIGLERMFSDNADFTGITDSPPLKISKILQKAIIEVNEEGSEAAAVTVGIAVAYSAPAQPIRPITVEIDRPFIYTIVHGSTNTVLFQGHITFPVMTSPHPPTRSFHLPALRIIRRAVQKYTTEMSEPAKYSALCPITASINKFSTEFYKSLVGGESGNVVCSPVSVSMTLYMVAFGARGNTENELKSVLHLPADNSVATSGIKLLVDRLSNFQKVKLNLANKIFTANGFEVKSEFKAITQSSFRSEVESVDFTKFDESSRIINIWCEKQTEGRIKDVVQPSDIQDASLILVNAIHFKGKWVEPFQTADTRLQSFSISETVSKEVPMMFTDANFNYGDLPDLDAQYIELPYESKDESDATSMYIILPGEVSGLKKVEENLEKVDFAQLNGPKDRVMLSLPKFKVESKLELEGALSKMGVKTAFTDAANFTGITDAPPLKVSKVIQKAFIEVNEAGTEAGAVTYMKMVLMCLPPSIVVDRPFLCALVAKSIGTPIFIAKVVDPTLTSLSNWSSIVVVPLQQNSTNAFTMSTPATADAVRTVATNTRKFSSEIYKVVADHHKKKNLICSPLSVSVVLSMLTYGAREITERELKSVLHFSENDTINKSGYQLLIDALNAIKSVQLKLANRIFVGDDFKIKPEFQQITETYFRSVSQNVNFKNTVEASKTINNWCKEKTNDRIKDVVQPGGLNGVELVLVNAVYFKGNWKKKFDATHTKPRTFHIDEKSTKEVPMMQIEGSYRLSELAELNAKCIELPYESSDETDAMSMFIILPDKIDGLRAIENKLDTTDLVELHKNESFSRKIDLQLPKFKIESTLNLNPILQKMGMVDMFDASANFQGMADSPISVSQVIQKAFIEVNEEGSEAAAVTAVMMVRCFLFLLAFLALHGYARGFIFPNQRDNIIRNLANRQNVNGENKFVNRQQVEDGMNKFALNLYKMALKRETGNLVICPYSAYMVLAMAAYGAEGRTKEELWKVLHLPREPSMYTEANLADILDAFTFSKPKLPLYITANMIVVNKDLSVRPEYLELLQNTFKTPLVTVDFSNRVQAAEIINAMSNKLTQKFVPKVVDANALAAEPSLMLVNSVFFYGEWAKPFSKTDTYPLDFYVSPGIGKKVSTMIYDGILPFGKLPKLNAQFVALPYKNTGKPEDVAYMYVILPNEEKGLARMEEKIDSLTLEDFKSTTVDDLTLFLPKFKIERNLQLGDHLVNLGARSAFSSAANFNGITKQWNNLYISDLAQKTFLSVDEKGTSGGATTIGELENKIMPKQLRFNRPFLAVIATKKLILFVGKVVDPSI